MAQTKSYQAVQQSAIIGLLNLSGFSFEFRRPERKAIKSCNCLDVIKMEYGQTVIVVDEPIQRLCDAFYDDDIRSDMKGSSNQTLTRRRNINKIAMVLNTLISWVKECGYTVHTKALRSARTTVQINTITDVCFKRKVLMDSNYIHYVGVTVNNYLNSHFISETQRLAPYELSHLSCMNQLKRNIPFANTITEIQDDVAADIP